MQSTPVFVGSGFVASYLEGGGSFWIPLQYLLGLHAHGVEAYWLEVFYASDDAASDRNRIQTFFERAKRLGAGERVVILYLFGGHDTDDAQLITANPLAGVDLRSAMRAGVLLNLNNHIPRAHRTGFARTVLYDIDPGMLQLWSKQADMGVGDHDLYITIGQSIGEAGCSVPECGVSWHRIWPTVHLPAWPMQDGVGARYTTVTHWWNGNRGYDLIDGQLYEHNKRTSFLEYIDMPGRTLGSNLSWQRMSHRVRSKIVKHSSSMAGDWWSRDTSLELPTLSGLTSRPHGASSAVPSRPC